MKICIFFVLLAIVIVLFAIQIALLLLFQSWKKKFWNEMSFCPATVNDYTVPRYVYENYQESVDYLPENGKIRGYRISPDLVINSRMEPADNGIVKNYYFKYLLTENDVIALMQNIEAINILRKNANEKPFDIEWFWAKKSQQPSIVNFKENIYKWVSDKDECYLAILKYNNADNSVKPGQ